MDEPKLWSASVTNNMDGGSVLVGGVVVAALRKLGVSEPVVEEAGHPGLWLVMLPMDGFAWLRVVVYPDEVSYGVQIEVDTP